jgi:hypothetical protein
MNLRYPSVQELYSAIAAANRPFDESDCRRLAEFCTLIQIKNSRLRGHILTRRTAVESWGWHLAGSAADDATQRLSIIIPLIIRSRINTPLYGSTVARIRWHLTDRGRQPLLDELIPPERILATSQNQARIISDNKEITVSADELLYDDGDLVQYLIETDSEHFRGGLLASVAINELLRVEILEEWIAWARKQKGIIQGIDRGADTQERATAEEALRNLLRHNYIISSDLVEFQFHQIANAQSGSAFKEIITELNNAIAIALLGQANTAELPRNSGSRAALQVQRLVSADIMYSDVLATENLINSQIIQRDWELNTGRTDPAPYSFRIRLEEEADYEANAAVIREAISAGIPLKKSEVYQKLGLTQPLNNDDILSVNYGV